ncbi:hypothetical protein Aple_011320 [Acrocarpospora pleiomorpha]|uniref:WxL domain-containing protein n=1 Tax=Acrocarpospora pleiomorpha TaxID=90975 RepID=A0A5M3X924_9ACTN|nr:hypothetical protein [Acrocarpospora pleiomorpha]GES18237.1 hypothetical protein Aple_011320 [Acrocarpospora pleiomorpha]
MSTMRNARIVCLSLALTGVLTVGALESVVSPALADTDTGNTTANIEVSSSITLTDLTASFTLTGSPGQTPTTGGTPVSMEVTTNNFAGYNVTVAPAAANLTGGIVGNTDTIPANLLQVDGPAQAGTFAPLTFGTPLVVASKASASAEGGDAITNNYRMTIPFVRPDTYTVTLNYVTNTL